MSSTSGQPQQQQQHGVWSVVGGKRVHADEPGSAGAAKKQRIAAAAVAASMQQQQQQQHASALFAAPGSAAAHYITVPGDVQSLMALNEQFRHRIEMQQATITQMASQLEAQAREIVAAHKQMAELRRAAMGADNSGGSLASDDIDDQSLSHISSTAAQLLHNNAGGASVGHHHRVPDASSVAAAAAAAASPRRRASSDDGMHGLTHHHHHQQQQQQLVHLQAHPNAHPAHLAVPSRGVASSGPGSASGSVHHPGRKSSSVCNLCGNDIQKDNMPGHLRNSCPVARELKLLAPRTGGGAPKATDTVQCRCGISLTNKNLPRHVQYACSATAEWRRRAAERQGLDAPPARSSPPRGTRHSPSRSDVSSRLSAVVEAASSSPHLAPFQVPSRKSRSPANHGVPHVTGVSPPPPLLLPPSSSSSSARKPDGAGAGTGSADDAPTSQSARIRPLPDASPSLALRESEVPSFLLELKASRSSSTA